MVFPAVDRPRVTLVVNPSAATGTAHRHVTGVVERLGRHVDLVTTVGASAQETRALVARYRDASDAIVVLGGDGTAHEAVQELAQTNVPLAVIPAGTGNDISAQLGWPADPLAAADAIGRAIVVGSHRRIDLGHIDVEPGDTNRGKATRAASPWWVGVLSAGFDSAVNELANRMRWPAGRRRYDIAIAIETVRLRPHHYRVQVDDDAFELDANLITVCNGPRYGGGIQIAPTARLDDGRFTICIARPVNRRTLARLAPKLQTGEHVSHASISFRTGQRVRIESDRIAYADGERIGELPLSTHIVASALTMVVPGRG
ncbi:MAG: sphingosine kinase [Pseudonocardiales bacterium]|nr:sphingosine kinase [Pseudonocardiales bacterium]